MTCEEASNILQAAQATGYFDYKLEEAVDKGQGAWWEHGHPSPNGSLYLRKICSNLIGFVVENMTCCGPPYVQSPQFSWNKFIVLKLGKRL